MLARPPFLITIYDKTLQRMGWLGDPDSLTINPRHNLIGSATVTVPTSHKKLPLLAADGARLGIIRPAGDGMPARHLMSGPIRGIAGKGGSRSGTVTFRIEDDIRLLWRILGWPVPGSPLNAQGTREDKQTGPTETVVKGFIERNANRLGLPVTVVPSHGWGPTITLAVRMKPLADVLLTPLEAAGLGLTVAQVDDQLVVDCYQTTTFPKTLTEQSGVVVDWDWSKDGPSATRTIVGGQGEGTAREFRPRTRAALEAEWGDIIETFTDARDTDVAAELDARGDEHLDESAPQAGLKVELSETKNFQLGRHIWIGDVTTLEVAPGVEVSDLLREAEITWDDQNGTVLKPIVGDFLDTQDPLKPLIKFVSKLSRSVRKLTTL